MATRLSRYSARFSSPELIERAKTQQLALEVYLDGSLVVPTSGTVTLRDASNTSIVDAAAVTVTDGVAQYELTAATVPATLAVAQNWLLEWALTFADGQVHTFRRTAHLCLRRLYPVLTDADLTRRHRNLASIVPAEVGSLQGYLDDAWDSIVNRLVQDSKFPQLVMSPDSFYEVHFSLTLSRIYEDMSANVSGDDDKFAKLSDFYRKTYAEDFARLKFIYDNGEDNLPPGDYDQGAAQGVVYLGGSPSQYDRYGVR